MFCKHDWKVINKEIIPSEAEVARRQYSWSPILYATTEIHITAYTCSKCGKLKIDKNLTIN